ncbi:uncharacterized protein [Henckelia pumila]|uniref:uncharacterized protein n=1 Tax=Henckelia pumila TaxID=405737 RepID=UPI003C6E870F
MTANSQQFRTIRNEHAPKKNTEVNVSSLEQQLIELTSLVRQMVVGDGKTAKSCGICAAVGHATDTCPTLQEESVEHVNATGGFLGPPQRKYDPYSYTYNPGWKDHPNLRYGNPQMGQLATAINKLEAQHSNALPSQPIPNPRENASAITLRNGKELKIKEKEVEASPKEKPQEEPKVIDGEATKEDAPRDAIKHVPRYAKFLKELCTAKKKQTLKGCQKVELGENVSAVIQQKFIAKCKDPGKDDLEVALVAPIQQEDGIGISEEASFQGLQSSSFLSSPPLQRLILLRNTGILSARQVFDILPRSSFLLF